MMEKSKSRAKTRVETALSQISELKSIDPDSQGFIKWQRNTRVAIANVFGQDSSHSKELIQISYTDYFSNDPRQVYLSGLDRAGALLESMIEEIDEYWADDKQEPIAPSPDTQGDSRRVFVVHGRDDGPLNEVARFLEKLDLIPVILREQPNEGRTVIEKFEEYAPVAFAVVLCTPDDVGALASDSSKLKPRPRQNVLLELGFFMGKLGRQRVCVLVKDKVEIPSDYAGVIYIPLNSSGGWQMDLVKELHKAGIPVDANRLLY